MDFEEHRAKVKEFAEWAPKPELNTRDLDELLYACSELGLLPIDGKLRGDDAVQIWRIVEAARLRGFPKSLRM